MDTDPLRHARTWTRRFVVGLVAAVLGFLNPLVAPVAALEPTDPLPCVPSVNCDEIDPFTTLTQTPAVVNAKTRQRTATFAFSASDDEDGTVPTEGATFECELTGPGQTAGFAACTTPRPYQDLADGTYSFKVRAIDESGNRDETPEVFAWSVDTTAPETSITSGPGTWVLANRATFGLRSTEPGSSVHCMIDGYGRYCSPTAATVTFGPGTHTFSAVATDPLGNQDATAASRTFTMPVDDRDLTWSSGWKRTTAERSFLGTISSSTKKGAALSASSSAIKRVVLVVTKGKGYGTVRVYLGKVLLKKVSLAATRTRTKQLVTVVNRATPTSGTIRVVVASTNKRVVVDGLGIASR